jgi:hypothetical protein
MMLSLSKSTGNTRIQSDALRHFAWSNLHLGDFSAAQQHVYESQRLAIISASLGQEAEGLHVEAESWAKLGNYKQSISLSHRARALIAVCGISGGHIDCAIMSCQALVHQYKSEYAEAHSIFSQILKTPMIEKDQYIFAMLVHNIAALDICIDAPLNEIQKNIAVAKKIFQDMGTVGSLIWCDFLLPAMLSVRERNVVDASMLFQQGLRMCWGKDHQAVSTCLQGLSNCWATSTMDSCTELDLTSWPTVFFVHSLKSKLKLKIYIALRFLGDVFLSGNDESTATSLFTIALEGFTYMDVHQGRADCMLRLGDISKEHGGLLKAVGLWKVSKPLFERSSQAKEVEKVNERLAVVNNDVLEQHRNNLARLAELNAPSGIVQELEDTSDISENEDLEKLDSPRTVL